MFFDAAQAEGALAKVAKPQGPSGGPSQHLSPQQFGKPAGPGADAEAAEGAAEGAEAGAGAAEGAAAAGGAAEGAAGLAELAPLLLL
jgi:hypothetical protein